MNKLLICLPALLLVGCLEPEIIGSGTIVTREYNVNSFRSVEACCGWDVVVSEAPTRRVEITGDDNIVPAIIAKSIDETLTLEYATDADRSPSQPIRVVVESPNITSLKMSSGGTAIVENVESDLFSFNASQGSSARFKSITTQSLNTALEGGSEALIDGVRVDQLNARLDGGSSISTSFQLPAVDLELAGGSRANVWVADTLVVDASGGSAVKYYGDPELEETVTDGSSVERLGDQPL